MNQVHTFVLCAYGESPFLEDCMRSLKAQTVPSDILISTSTPNAHIEEIAKKYDAPLYINQGEAGITGDWNFGISHAHTPYMTIAHQDDIYDPAYTETVLQAVKKSKQPIMISSLQSAV